MGPLGLVGFIMVPLLVEDYNKAAFDMLDCYVEGADDETRTNAVHTFFTLMNAVADLRAAQEALCEQKYDITRTCRR